MAEKLPSRTEILRDELNKQLRAKIERAILGRTAPDGARQVMEDLELYVSYISREHGAGSALEPDESPEEYAERVAPKTIYRISGGWREKGFRR